MNREQRRAQQKNLPDAKKMLQTIVLDQGIWIGVYKPNPGGLIADVVPGDGDKAVMNYVGFPTETNPLPLPTMETGVPLLDKCAKHVCDVLTVSEASAVHVEALVQFKRLPHEGQDTTHSGTE